MTTINDKVDTLQEDMTQMKADFAVIRTTFKQINGKLDKGFGANYEHKVADNIGSIAG